MASLRDKTPRAVPPHCSNIGLCSLTPFSFPPPFGDRSRSWDAGTPLEITASFADIPGLSSATKAQVRDLWLHQDMGTFTGSYTALVDPHGVVMITLTPAT